MDTEDSGQSLEKAAEGSKEVDEERPSKERRLKRSCVVRLFTLHKRVKQLFDFAVRMGMTNETDESEDHD